ncbi:MAG: transketolase [Candidatus Diapherotrites archaeon]|nr:transketolase [Candidatus Diapherotrites archaeon]
MTSVNELIDLTKTVRKDIVEMIHIAGSGHPGGSLSSAELFVALYFNELNHNPENPLWSERDRFVLSKGHVCPALYSVMARSGYFPVEELKTLRKLNSRLQGHPDMRKLPGIEVSTGSLGQGLSVAIGMALGLRADKKENRVYCMLGDGELNEGQVWEAVMSAGHYKLNNLIALVDRNNLQIDGVTEDVMQLEPLKDKWISFNWNVIECNGHEMSEVLNAFEKAKKEKVKPSVIIAHTVKGKGVSFMEDKAGWHGKSPNEEEKCKALEELL